MTTNTPTRPTPRKRRPLTPRQVRFVAEYLVDLNSTQSAIRAGYAPKRADQIGYENLRKPEVAAAVAKGTARHLEKAELSASRVLEELRRLAFVDVTGVFDDAGRLRPLREWTPEQRAALAGYEVIVKNAAAGDGHTDTVHKVKLHDKLKALDLLARHFALLHDQVSIEGDWDKLAARLASAKARIRGASGGDTEANVSPRHSVAR